MSNLVYFQENSIRKPFVYISFEKLYKLRQPYKFSQKVSNYFVPEYTPPMCMCYSETENFQTSNDTAGLNHTSQHERLKFNFFPSV